ncbi:MAG: hypothetical protein IGS50_01345 [Synechococcales cyanobacterium C42_A2020_086]|nr:hypothetical protein [Synechococcales cyanobacterium M58_A2018_015]MBF2072399.1 hypothetical protein [Synechococcales cyanobacterium C42_A2020_086]
MNNLPSDSAATGLTLFAGAESFLSELSESDEIVINGGNRSDTRSRRRPRRRPRRRLRRRRNRRNT